MTGRALLRLCLCGASRSLIRIKTRGSTLTVIAAMIALSACADKSPPPLPTPGPDLCLSYSSYNYNKAAAAVENIANLRAHNSNEATFYEKCVAHRQGTKPGGSR